MKRVIFIGLLLMLFTGCFNSDKGSSEEIEEPIVTETIEGQTETILTKDDLTAESFEDAKKNLYGDDEAKIIRNGNEIEKIEVVKTSGKPSRIFKSSEELVLEPENTMSTNKIISKLNIDEYGYTKIEKGANISANELIEKIKESYPDIFIDYEIRNEELYIKPIIVFEGETNIKEYLLTALFDVEYKIEGAEKQFLQLQTILGLKKDIAIMGKNNELNQITYDKKISRNIKRTVEDTSYLGKNEDWYPVHWSVAEQLQFLNDSCSEYIDNNGATRVVINGVPEEELTMENEKYLFPKRYEVGDSIAMQSWSPFNTAVIYLAKPKNRARMAAMYDWAFCSHYKHVGILDVAKYLGNRAKTSKEYDDLAILSASNGAYDKNGNKGFQMGYESVNSWKNSENYITAMYVSFISFKWGEFGENSLTPPLLKDYFNENQGKPYLPLTFSSELVYHNLKIGNSTIKIPDILIKFEKHESYYCSKVAAQILFRLSNEYENLKNLFVVRPDDIFNNASYRWGYIPDWKKDFKEQNEYRKNGTFKKFNKIERFKNDLIYDCRMNKDKILEYDLSENARAKLKEILGEK
ncbi:MAG: hypothetical protein KBA47_01585 [Caldisericia bacterium]|nr:hypothetical protein [Caldisericia bacterium]